MFSVGPWSQAKPTETRKYRYVVLGLYSRTTVYSKEETKRKNDKKKTTWKGSWRSAKQEKAKER